MKSAPGDPRSRAAERIIARLTWVLDISLLLTFPRVAPRTRHHMFASRDRRGYSINDVFNVVRVLRSAGLSHLLACGRRVYCSCLFRCTPLAGCLKPIIRLVVPGWIVVREIRGADTKCPHHRARRRVSRGSESTIRQVTRASQ